MNIDALNKWLTLVSNFGVIAGFVLLAVQLNQNTQALRMQNFGDFSREVASMEVANMGDTPNVSYAAALDHPSTLTSAELLDVWAYLNGGVYAGLHTWDAYREGYASESAWNVARGAAAAYIDFPAGRIIWKHTKSTWPAEFVDEIDRELARSGHQSVDGQWLAVKNDLRVFEANAAATN